MKEAVADDKNYRSCDNPYFVKLILI